MDTDRVLTPTEAQARVDRLREDLVGELYDCNLTPEEAFSALAYVDKLVEGRLALAATATTETRDREDQWYRLGFHDGFTDRAYYSPQDGEDRARKTTPDWPPAPVRD